MKARKSVGAIVVTFAMSSLGVACGGSNPEAKAPPAPTAAQNNSASASANSSGSSQGTVAISDDIRKKCGIDENEAYFSFDSAKLLSSDVQPLNKVATCFVSGPLKGHKVKVLGHTDPRGTSDYNMTLGQSRADSVASYLGKKGLDSGRRESSSRGAMDATGQDESGWSKDRRVDLLLGD